MIIRKGMAEDLPALQDLLLEVSMGDGVNPEDFLVAEETGALAGAVCLQRYGACAYVRAMAVHDRWRGQGVGRQLVEELLSGQDQVKVVARGSAVPFYRKMGFRTIAWDTVDPEVSQECAQCPDVAACHPEPMLFERSASDRHN